MNALPYVDLSGLFGQSLARLGELNQIKSKLLEMNRWQTFPNKT